MERFYRHLDSIAERPTLKDFFEKTGMDCTQPYCVYWDNGPVQVSYAAMKARALQYAAALRQLTAGHIRRGYVGLKLPNSPLWAEIFWGLLAAGFRPVLIGGDLDARSTGFVLRQAGAVALVALRQEEADGLPVFTPEMLEAAFRQENSFQPTWANELAFCSSGTTTDPKLFYYDGEAVFHLTNTARSIPQFTDFIMYPDTLQDLRQLAVLPFHHIFGFVAVFFWYTFFGKTLVFPRSLNPDTLLEDCQNMGVTHIYAVPMLWNRVANTLEAKSAEKGIKGALLRKLIRRGERLQEGMDTERLPDFLVRAVQKHIFGSKIQFCISGGGAVSGRTLGILNAMGYSLHNGYGLTEAGIVAVDCEPDPVSRVQGSIGRPLFGYALKILPSGSDPAYGELLLRGKMLHTGQLIRGEKEPARLDEEGWFHTGDMVRLRQDGRYWISGRSKDVIINASGENILPDELEAHFSRLPFVVQLCVLGLDSAGTGEEIVLVLQTGGDRSAQEMHTLRDAVIDLNEALPLHRRVRVCILAKEPMPVANTIKVQRKKLRTGLEEGSFRCVRMHLHKDELLYEAAERTLDPALLQAVREAFCEALHLQPEELSNNAHFVYDLGGDSFAYAGVLQTLTDRTGLTIPPEDYARCSTVYDFALLLDKQAARDR